jgi:hypothetical protein
MDNDINHLTQTDGLQPLDQKAELSVVLAATLGNVVRDIQEGLCTDMVDVAEMRSRVVQRLHSGLTQGCTVTSRGRDGILLKVPGGEPYYFSLALCDSPRRSSVREMLSGTKPDRNRLMKLLKERAGSQSNLTLIYAARFDRRQTSGFAEERLRQCEQGVMDSARQELDQVAPSSIILDKPLRSMLLVFKDALFQADLSYAGKTIAEYLSEGPWKNG